MKTKMPEFTPTQWNTSKDKQKFATQLLKLVKGDFQQADFPKWFYQRLMNCFGHIAHYNQNGFWVTWFDDPASQYNFLVNILNYPCYGDPGWTYSDVEKWIQEQPIITEKRDELAQKIMDKMDEDERSENARLQKKFG